MSVTKITNNEKSELIKRWSSHEGDALRKQILRALSWGADLSKVRGLTKILGRWDLRGIKLPEPETLKNIRTYVMLRGEFTLKKIELNNIDFTFADLSYSSWIKCSIKNCIFNNAKLVETGIRACHFSNATFENSNLSNSYLALNIGKDSGSFVRTDFIKSNLSSSSFRFPKIEECSFIDCRLKETLFDGSRFMNCKFKGEFESGWINGYSVYASKSTLKIFDRVEPKEYPNKMVNVDFSECNVIDVFFGYRVDLKDCVLPLGDKYLVVKNLDLVYPKVKQIISSEWDSEDKEWGLRLIDNVLYATEKQEMPMDIFNTMLYPELGKEFCDRFFALVRKVNSEIAVIN